MPIRRSQYFGPSAHATNWLGSLKGIEVGGSIHNSFEVDAVNVDSFEESVFKDEERRLSGGATLPVDIRGDCGSLPFRDNSVDFVLASHVLEHFWNPIAVVGDWMRVARRYVYIVLPKPDASPGDANKPITTVAELLDRNEGRVAVPALDGPSGHLSIFSHASFRELCDSQNWKVLDSMPTDDKVGNGFTYVLDASEAHKKILITGTGRCGSTFLIALLAEIGFDCELSSIDSSTKGGHEVPVAELFLADGPQVMKTPFLLDHFSAIWENRDRVQLVLIPVRNISDAALSRHGNTIAFDAGVPGGLWNAETLEDQERELQGKLLEFILLLVEHGFPYKLLDFRRMTTDPGYLFNALRYPLGLSDGHAEALRLAHRTLSPQYKARGDIEMRETGKTEQEVNSKCQNGATTRQKTFSHSGDLGDIIYALPAIRYAGGGRLILFNFPGDPGVRTAHGMTEAKVERLRPLLEKQDYIHSVEWSPFPVPYHDLNGFRDHLGAHGNLADAHLSTVGGNWLGRENAWLQAESPTPSWDVIFSRSSRYHNDSFPWAQAVQVYAGRAGFMGFPQEHADFCDRFGHVPLVVADDFMAMANLIAGSKLFIGNQSSALAVAHAMKHRVVMEISPDAAAQQHCVFQRIDCIIGWDHKIEWPKI